jgi:hypothetical protein
MASDLGVGGMQVESRLDVSAPHFHPHHATRFAASDRVARSSAGFGGKPILARRVRRGGLALNEKVVAALIRTLRRHSAKGSARIDEDSCQLFAPVVQISLFGYGVKIEGIGGRLASEIHAIQENVTMPAHTLRFDRLRFL